MLKFAENVDNVDHFEGVHNVDNNYKIENIDNVNNDDSVMWLCFDRLKTVHKDTSIGKQWKCLLCQKVLQTPSQFLQHEKKHKQSAV